MKRFKKHHWLLIIFVLALLVSCKTRHNAPQQISPQYTCPMPTDSFFSNTPGKCPKCGMELIKIKATPTNDSTGQMQILTEGYTCPMHPQVHSDTAGSCPLCGMQLEKVKSATEPKAVSLDVLIKPVNQQVIASIPMVHMMDREEDIEMESYGFVTYDTREVGTIASYITGRIEKLYVHYRFQKITKGQKLMDIYSPEILTAQENLLFLLKNDRENENLITAAKQKLRLLGMSNQQLAGVIQTGKAVLTIAVFSNYSGHIHESNTTGGMINVSTAGMKDISITTTELSLKEGMYVQKGQNMFTVFNPAKAWVVLNIFAEQASMVKVGNKVRIVPETAPVKDFRAAINYIEPVYRPGTKTLSARVYFDNATLKIPIGSQVKATLFGGNRTANWLPEEAVLSLGLDKVVFVWTGESFTARKIETGIINKHLLQILNGIDKNEAVAANAQYLVDSESFIKTK
jgi:Cu(I)/Ag(I) efflux system membrane fusion protein